MRSCRTLPAILTVLLLTACASASSPPPPVISPTARPTPVPGPESPTLPHPPQPSPLPALRPVADEGHVSYSITLHAGQCHALDSGRNPDPACTPGSVDPEVTQATISITICVRGWTATIRPPSSETTALKHDVAYPAYSIPPGTVSELDHQVPLELGGSNDITNLWPETGAVPNAKDPVENDLRADVCSGELTLTQAQDAIAADWETVP